jgi:hypothetical protein
MPLLPTFDRLEALASILLVSGATLFLWQGLGGHDVAHRQRQITSLKSLLRRVNAWVVGP